MQKLKLQMERLEVESFEVAPPMQTWAGTVAGHAAEAGVAAAGGGDVVIGPGTSEVYSKDCWTLQQECWETKDPRYYPCICTYPIPETREGPYCAVEAEPISDVKAASF